MVISDFLKDKIKGILSNPIKGRDDDLDVGDDFETKDKKLRALRRLRRRQMDIIETKQLRKTMDEFQRAKDREDFVGESMFNSTLDGGTRKPKESKQNFFGNGSSDKTKFL